jgi:beta-lactamase regulating signal transducer with metallopeptidase domain
MTLCALLLYVVYLGLLEKEKMHRFKRLFLLCGLVFSMTVPLLTISPFHSPIQENMEIFGITEISMINTQEYPVATHQFAVADETAERFPVSLLLAGLYLLVTLGLLVRMARNLLKMHASSTVGSDIVDYCGVKIVLIKQECIPHSFGKRIFVSEEAYRKGEIPAEILLHEWAHIKQKHSLDIIFIESLIAIFWFNPVFYLYRHKIKLNHEFLADEAVLANNGDILRYQKLLIYTDSSLKTHLKLASNFNYLITKKRFFMMTKTTSKKRALWLITALAPVLLAAIFAFSQKTAAQNEPEHKAESVSATKAEPETIIPEQGVSQELLDEYKAFEKKYLADVVTTANRTEWKWNPRSISEDDWKPMYVIYFQMNEEQRKSTLISWWGPLSVSTFGIRTMKSTADGSSETTLFVQPDSIPKRTVKNAPPPPPPPPPKLWEQWKNQEKFQIRVYGEAGKTDLKSLNRLDYTHYFVSESLESGKANLRIVYLWTKSTYEAYHQQYDKSIPVAKLLEIKPHEVFTISHDKKVKDGDLEMITTMGKTF